MAKVIKEYHECDFCGVQMEKPYNGGEGGTFKLSAEVDYATCGHTTRYQELCNGCNGIVGGFIREMEIRAKGMRKARFAQKFQNAKEGVEERCTSSSS